MTQIKGMSITYVCPNTGEEATSWTSRFQLDLIETYEGPFPVLTVWIRCKKCTQDHELEFRNLN